MPASSLPSIPNVPSSAGMASPAGCISWLVAAKMPGLSGPRAGWGLGICISNELPGAAPGAIPKPWEAPAVSSLGTRLEHLLALRRIAWGWSLTQVWLAYKETRQPPLYVCVSAARDSLWAGTLRTLQSLSFTLEGLFKN